MKADQIKNSIAYCGLICLLCRDESECSCKADNNCGKRMSPEGCFQHDCCTTKGFNGCWECPDAPCDKDMFTPIEPGRISSRRKLRAFITCMKEDGIDRFAQYITDSVGRGFVYHRTGVYGDYDLDTEDLILQLLRTGAFAKPLQPAKLVSFDLDDTLTRDIHSVLLPCILNGKEKECRAIDAREEAGELDYIAADYLKAELFKGLDESKIEESFHDIAKPLDNIKHVVGILRESGIMCIVITVGPKQVAKVVRDIYGLDDYYGSDYEVVNGVFTGKIREYLSAERKIDCVVDFCNRHDIAPSECIAVGDGATDIPVFEFCGVSIAINAKPEVKSKATYSIDTQDLIEILPFIIKDDHR